MGKYCTVALAVLLGGCSTTLETRPVTMQNTRIDGPVYALPVAEIETTASFRLIKCEPKKQATTGALTGFDLDFKIEAANKVEFVPGEYFSLDYSSLASALKTSEFKVTWHDNRMLKSINVSVVDKSIETGVEVLKTGISIAKLAGGIPPIAGAQGTVAKAVVACPTVTLTARASAEGLRKTATGKLEAANKELADLLKLGDQAPEIDVKIARDAAKAATGDIKKYGLQVAEADKVLVYTEVRNWQPTRSDFAAPMFEVVGVPIEFVGEADDPILGRARTDWLYRLFKNPELPGTTREVFFEKFGPLDVTCNTSAEPKCEAPDFELPPGPGIARKLTTNMKVSPIGMSDDLTHRRSALGISEPKSGNTAGESKSFVAGVVTRQPVKARLLVCSGWRIPCVRGSQTKLSDDVFSLPQMGPYIVLPFTNGVGEDNTLNAEFAASGEPTMVEYKSKSAVALSAAQALGGGADALNSYYLAAEAKRDADSEALLGEPAAELERLKKELLLKQEIATLQASLGPPSPITLLENQVKELEQRKKIAEMEAFLSPQPDAFAEELERLNREIQIKTARLQELQIDQLLRDAADD